MKEIILIALFLILAYAAWQLHPILGIFILGILFTI